MMIDSRYDNCEEPIANKEEILKWIDENFDIENDYLAKHMYDLFEISSSCEEQVSTLLGIVKSYEVINKCTKESADAFKDIVIELMQ